MGDLQAQSLDSPHETRTFDNGKAELVTVAGSTVGRFTFQPGWKWSESVKKIVGTDSCQNHHVGYAISGRLKVVSNDGSEQEIKAGDAYNIPPGHDAWVVGSDPVVTLEFRSAADYAKK
jgi:mannose-6-phosphate isomerase-like protein (cupin superfamily)